MSFQNELPVHHHISEIHPIRDVDTRGREKWNLFIEEKSDSNFAESCSQGSDWQKFPVDLVNGMSAKGR